MMPQLEQAATSLSPQSAPNPCAAIRNAGGRSNAATHGLSATTLLPQILGADVIERHSLQLRAEWQPATPTEEILVDEMARHAAALERASAIEIAVLRCGAAAMAQLDAAACTGQTLGAEGDELLLAAAMNQDNIDRLTRYRRAHEKAWHHALQRLRELRLTARPKPTACVPPTPFPFTDEACAAYLRDRFGSPDYRCGRCGHAAGYVLASRDRRQCANCHHQAGLRDGTVMEGSHLSFSVWFTLVWQLLHRPDTSRDELAHISGVARAATLHQLREKILAALAAADCAGLLFGLGDDSSNAT